MKSVGAVGKNASSAFGRAMNPRHSADFTVHLHHVGPAGRAGPGLFFDCFQDAASLQSARLGFSIRKLIREGLTWVVARYRLEVFRYPRWQERIRVTTWRSPQQGVAAPREFEVTDGDDQTLAIAQGLFILLDRATHRPVSPSDHLPGYPVADDTVFENEFATVPKVRSPEAEQLIQVRRGDLDLNRHVNNTRYITFAMESVPLEIYRSCTLDHVQIAFKKAAVAGDTIRSLIQSEPSNQPLFIHRLTDYSGTSEYARLVTRWKSCR